MEFQALYEKYLMTLSFYNVDSPPYMSGSFIGQLYATETHTVAARLTNTKETPLTDSDLRSLVHSLPYLHYRINNLPHWVTNLCPTFFQVTVLPPDYTPPQKHCSLAEWPGMCEYQPVISVPAQPYFSTGCEDWMQCDGSFVPICSNPAGGEWMTVDFDNQTVNRFFSPVGYIDNSADIVGRCTVTDFTVYGQYQLSVIVDLLAGEGFPHQLNWYDDSTWTWTTL